MSVKDPKFGRNYEKKSFNLFGPATKNDIKVGYISPDRGYVSGIGICEANRYAELNPGTTFIYKTREKIDYLNINQVNRLTPEDLNVGDADPCSGVKFDVPCNKPPTVDFYGGGGVGVKGNPVIGKDGSLMAIHLVSGGNGYQYPPLVDVKDKCGIGGGAVAQAQLGEVIVPTKEVYSDEDEFEEYFPDDQKVYGDPTPKQFCEIASSTDVNHGPRYGLSPVDADGNLPKESLEKVGVYEVNKDLGAWKPAMYVSFEDDPFAKQVRDYQDFLKELTKPWWTVRKKKPFKITSEGDLFAARSRKLSYKPLNKKYDVQHYAWGGEKELNDISKFSSSELVDVSFDIYTEGGHGRGLLFEFVAEDESHRFTIKADDYKDGGPQTQIIAKVKPGVNYKVTSKGSHRRNLGTKQGLIKSFGSNATPIGNGVSDKIFADLLATNDDYDDLQIYAKGGRFKTTGERSNLNDLQQGGYDLVYRFDKPLGAGGSTEGTGLTSIKDTFMNRYAISPIPMSNKPGSDFAGILFTLEWEENFPYDGDYVFKGQSDNHAVFYFNGQKEGDFVLKSPTKVKKFVQKGNHKIRLDLLNFPEHEKLILQEPPPPEPPAAERKIICHAGGGKGGNDDIEQVVGGRVIVGQGGSGGSGGDDDMYGRHHGGRGGGAGLRNGSHSDNPISHQELDRIGPGVYKGGPGGFGVNFDGFSVGTIQQTVSSEEYSGGDGIFMGGGGGGTAKGGRSGHGGNGGIMINVAGKRSTYTNPGAYTYTIPGTVTPIKKEKITPASAKFIQEGDDLFVEISGNGHVNIDFRMGANDKSKHGYATQEIKIGDVLLSRIRGGRVQKKIDVSATGRFAAGKKYKIDLIGRSEGAGAPRVFDNRIELLDNHRNDTNVSLDMKFFPEDVDTGGVHIVCIGGGGSGFYDADGDKRGSGGSGGAYAWTVQDLPAGSKLKVYVGNGGQGGSTKGSKGGSDSYVELIPVKKPEKPKKKKNIIPGIQTKKVFNTVDYINKASRQLWRTNVYNRGGFLNEAGICPFDTTKELEDNPYAGSHTINWNSVNFPVDGNYTIKVDVDDNVTLSFHSQNETITIKKEGFFIAGDGDTATGPSTYTRYFKKGTYRIQADLEQIPGGKFGFRKDSNAKEIKVGDVNFRVTSSAAFANKITIPGLFSFSKTYKGADINQSVTKTVDIGKEYDVILTSAQKGSNFNSNRVKLRIRDGGKTLEMEEYKDNSWKDVVCTVSNGKFYSITGNRCKFRLDATIKGINPMALAVDVQVAYAEKTVQAAKSWYENPMGVALTIDAPLPPVPQQEKPEQKGRCPNNPMWTTRFSPSPKDGKRWFPVMVEKGTIHGMAAGKSWSKFLNEHAMSPVPPLSWRGTDAGGTVFTNIWDVNVPYAGWYKLKAEVDDIARIYVDDDLKLDLSRKKNKIGGESKFLLEAGLKKIKIEMENYTTQTFTVLDKKIFSARDWLKPGPIPLPPVEVQDVICHAGGGKGGTDDKSQNVGGRVIVGKGGSGGSGGDDDFYGDHHGGRGGGAGLRNGKHSDNPISHQELDRIGPGTFKGGPGGFGVNFQGNVVGDIQSTVSTEESSGGDGISMGAGGGGKAPGRGRSGHGGNGGVKITWGLTGKSQDWTKPGKYEVVVPGNIGKSKKNQSVPVTAKFEGTSVNDLHLVVSGTGTIECSIVLYSDDKWNKDGLALTEMRCGDIILTRTQGKTSETLTGTGTFVGGKRYKVEVIGADSQANAPRIFDTRVELCDRHRFDTNVSLDLKSSSKPQPMDGVSIVCIGGGGSGFCDIDGDHRGSGGSGGAYAWVNRDIAAGTKLEIIVGTGGKGGTEIGSKNGNDSYVRIIKPPPRKEPQRKPKGEKKGGVTYNGPYLFQHLDKRWSELMNKFNVSPLNSPNQNLTLPHEKNVDTKILVWSGVDFPLVGNYDVTFLADNVGNLYIDGQKIMAAATHKHKSRNNASVNITSPGKKEIKVEVINVNHDFQEFTMEFDKIFNSNPTGVVLEITKKVNIANVDPNGEIDPLTGKPAMDSKSWLENPMGVSAILIPPPCEQDISGKGVVVNVDVIDPGQGFPPLREPKQKNKYPVALKPKGVIVTNPGINYGPEDVLSLQGGPTGIVTMPITLGPFGTVAIDPFPPNFPPPGFSTSVPLVVSSPTGVNFQGALQYDVVPLLPSTPPRLPDGTIVPDDQIIQVTDLAGIKQTGYYEGKAYYGAVYYNEEGIRYAGWYETAGEQIRIYATMQESIDAMETTPPSAILRQGSDVTSNDPRLNIPGTPENLI